MAEKNRYPQIPSTVWWGVRSIIQRTPNATIDERLLGVQLNVQEVAARAYIFELRNVGLLTEEGKATPLAQKWRLDESYTDAVGQIIQSTYPEGLIQVAPPGEAERQKVVSWFLREGFGQGAAGNKAATYLLLSSPTPNEPPRVSTKVAQNDGTPRSRKQADATKPGKTSNAKPLDRSGDRGNNSHRRDGVEAFPLNLNVQIHISADAGTEQIESIFKAMKRYLYDNPNT
ncbi:hypothetical protein [Mesorhizobium sp. A623]